MHVSSALNAIKKWGTFKAYKEAHEAYPLQFTTLSNPERPSNPATFGNPLTLSNADDVMLMSPSKSKHVHITNNTPTASNPPEGKTTAVIAVMRVNPKDGYTRQCSNKHCK